MGCGFLILSVGCSHLVPYLCAALWVPQDFISDDVTCVSLLFGQLWLLSCCVSEIYTWGWAGCLERIDHGTSCDGNTLRLLFLIPPPLPCYTINPLNAELNPIRHLLALVGARHIVHVSRIRINPWGHMTFQYKANRLSNNNTSRALR